MADDVAQVVTKIISNDVTRKTVATPCDAYVYMRPMWARSRAICQGERQAKDFDRHIDVVNFENLLVPFSPTMSQQQYDFYKAEAELPGIVAQYSKIIVGGLLRKEPQFTLPEDVPEGAEEWIRAELTQNNGTLLTFLDSALWEEVQTSRAWVYIDHPATSEDTDPEILKNMKPYPVLWNAESVINWKTSIDPNTGAEVLSQIIMSSFVMDYTKNEFHAELIPTIWVHELVNGEYRVRIYQQNTPANEATKPDTAFVLVKVVENIMAHGKRLTYIPVWPLNGNIDPVDPILSPLIDREIALYNKVSRRNHLLYGAATYTPVVSSNMVDEDFDEIVNSGLGSWIKLNQGDSIDVLKPPTESLKDMESSIAATIEEMAKMGVRMLSPETGEQSGIALEIRNAAQTAQLGSLNARVSAQMNAIIAALLNWRYDKEYTAADVQFTLSADFNPAPLGADWLRLVTEWYQQGLIPRSVFLQIAKQNDILPPEYDDEDGQAEINEDEMIANPREQQTFSQDIEQKRIKLEEKKIQKMGSNRK